MFKHTIVLMGAAALAGCSENVETTKEKATEPKMDHAKIVTGNGENNHISLDGAYRTEATFTFPNVTLAKDGFLVFHPFKDGKPVQTEYVAAKALSGGSHDNVSIDVSDGPKTGDMYIVMLHFDMNEDGVFDFNDGVTVPDAPVFEGQTLVALRFQTPESR